MPEIFEVRGHHASTFLLLYQIAKFLRPEVAVATTVVDSMTKIKSVSWIATMDTAQMTPDQYRQDVFGPGSEGEQAYALRLGEIFSHFLSLSDQDLVLFTASLDPICGACDGKKHCVITNRQNEQRALNEVLPRVKLDDTMTVAELKQAFDRHR